MIYYEIRRSFLQYSRRIIATMSLFCRVIQPTDLEEIMAFENKKMLEIYKDETERNIQSWNARWRKESLDHYLPMGWSFLARFEDTDSEYSNEGQLAGYFIAQPMLFLDGQTQSLWIEHISYASLKARDELCELAYKMAREKHFQKVYFPNSSGIMNSVSTFKPETWQPQVISIKTTKI